MHAKLHNLALARTLALALALAAAAGAACGDNQTHPEHDLYPSGQPQPLPCLPNLDGKIESSEMQPVLGSVASFLTSPSGTDRTVNLDGFQDQMGHQVWDWSTDLADDRIFRATATGMSGKWYAATFPGAQFASSFDAAGTTEAVYRVDDQALWLLGLASTVEKPADGQTLFAYSTPIALFRFPIAQGASWTSVGEVRNGMLRGLPYAGRDTYQVADDATGMLLLPDLSFTQAHRIRTTVTVEPAVGMNHVQRQVSFLFECFGEVARATSKLDETQDDFTTASEVRRLGLEGSN
jgi:hypothetical protein